LLFVSAQRELHSSVVEQRLESESFRLRRALVTYFNEVNMTYSIHT